MKKRVLYGLLALVFSTLACEPVIAIGKNELLCLLVLIIALLGPPIYRFVRRIEILFKENDKDKTK
jgi:hypothetical protein